MRIYLFR